MVRKHSAVMVVDDCVCEVCVSMYVARKLIDNKGWCMDWKSWTYGGQTREIENGLEKEDCSTKT